DVAGAIPGGQATKVAAIPQQIVGGAPTLPLPGQRSDAVEAGRERPVRLVELLPLAIPFGRPRLGSGPAKRLRGDLIAAGREGVMRFLRADRYAFPDGQPVRREDFVSVPGRRRPEHRVGGDRALAERDARRAPPELLRREPRAERRRRPTDRCHEGGRNRELGELPRLRAERAVAVVAHDSSGWNPHHHHVVARLAAIHHRPPIKGVHRCGDTTVSCFGRLRYISDMTKSRRVRYSTRGLPVSDRERLARIFATLERRSGGQKAAARALGITPPYFWRLRHGKGGEAISRGLFDRIAALLGADKRTVRELKRAVVNAETRPQRRAYYAWLHRGYRLMTAGGR